MTIDISQLQSFLMVVDQGNFTLAAERLGRTQSAISQQIARLEIAIGKKLLNRTKPFQLTPDGDVFYRYARQILDLHDSALSYFKEPDVSGDIRFGVPEDFASLFLSEILAHYSITHPRLHLNIECDLTLNLYKRFKKGEFDLALVKMSRPEDVPHATEMWSEQLLWVGSRRNLTFTGDIPLILSPKPCIYREHALRALTQKNIKWSIRFSSMSHASKIAAVQAGMGITVLPRKLVPKNLQCFASSQALPPLDDIQVTLLQNNTNQGPIQALSDYIHETLRQR
ncbi:MAG: LysR family transcriptional regulator [Alphaproteobacteria bacterium]|nr:MAG: LysR family transcriptional regulator [Alphaproteobacteria bacterium]